MGPGNACRDECDPVTLLNDVVKFVRLVVDEYRFNFFQGEIEFTGDIAGRAPSFRDADLGRGF